MFMCVFKYVYVCIVHLQSDYYYPIVINKQN